MLTWVERRHVEDACWLHRASLVVENSIESALTCRSITARAVFIFKVVRRFPAAVSLVLCRLGLRPHMASAFDRICLRRRLEKAPVVCDRRGGSAVGVTVMATSAHKTALAAAAWSPGFYPLGADMLGAGLLDHDLGPAGRARGR